MNKKDVVLASVGRRNYYRVTGIDKPYMANECFIQNLIDCFALIRSSACQASQCRPVSWDKSRIHRSQGYNSANAILAKSDPCQKMSLNSPVAIAIVRANR